MNWSMISLVAMARGEVEAWGITFCTGREQEKGAHVMRVSACHVDQRRGGGVRHDLLREGRIHRT